MIGKWVKQGDTISSDETLVRENEQFGFSVALNKRGTRLVVSAPKAKANSNPVNPEPGYDRKIEIYDLVNSQWNLAQTIFGDASTIEGSKGLDVSITPKAIISRFIMVAITPPADLSAFMRRTIQLASLAF